MKANTIRTISICLLTQAVIAGFIAPMGLLSEPMAEQNGISIPAAAAQFSYLTGGVFLGYILSFYVFDLFRIKIVYCAVYAGLVAATLLLHAAGSLLVQSFALLLTGIFASIAVVTAGTIISRGWHGKPRQALLVLQDVVFNGGGIAFTLITTIYVARNLPWTAAYLTAAAIAMAALLLAAVTRIESDTTEHETKAEGRTEWNAGIVLVGVSVLLFMTAKISVFLWAPQFVEQTFDVGGAESSQLMRNIFTAALLGSIAATYIASRVPIHYLLTGLLSFGLLSLWSITRSTSVETAILLGYFYGLSVSATFNSYTAFGLTFVTTPTHKNVAYLLLCGGIGSTLAPIVSSKTVEWTGNVHAAMMLCVGLMAIVLISVLLLARTQPMRIFENG